MSRESAATDHILALTLKAGAYTSLAMILAGLFLTPLFSWAAMLATAGVLVLLATPVLRIIVAGIQFFRERDLRYAVVSFGVLSILVLAYWLGIQT